MAERKPRTIRGLMKHRAALPSVIGVGILVALLAADAAMQQVYAQRVLPGVHVGPIALGGMTLPDAQRTIQQATDAVETKGVTIQYGSVAVPVDYTLADSNGLGLAVDIVSYDAVATASQAFAIGHHQSFLRDSWNRLRIAFGPTQVSPVYDFDRDAMATALKNALGKYETPVVDPGFTLHTNGSVGVSTTKAGSLFDIDALDAVVENRVQNVSSEAIVASLRSVGPSMSAADAATVIPDVQRIVDGGQLTLHAGTQSQTVKPSVFVGWLAPMKKGKTVTLGVSDIALATYVRALAPQLNVAPKNARFYIDNGSIKMMNASSNGSELDAAAAQTAIATALVANSKDVTLPMKDVAALAGADNIANLGVKEIVGTATTSFAGSPANRRHNIQVGASLLNGLLIKPGEEFSTITAVGPVDASNGYLQELVILGNKTTPEFGGGLCQIGTTFFRAVMNAGLPVLERKNHSYRVSYYEPPAGMDATIYEPKPDFRFKNDYAGYLLIQTHIDGNTITFELWGAKDGRTSAETTPHLYNFVSPPPQETIETTDIPVGTTKCTEHAHTGADADFTYTVTYADGTVKTQVFKSHYKPWQAVCLVGVKKVKNTNGNSNTNGNTNTNKNSNINTNAAANANTATNTNSTTNTNAPVNTNTGTNTNGVTP